MGLRQNLEAIKQEGFEQGIEQGIEQGVLSVAKRLISLGMDNAVIMGATGLAADKIEQLRKEAY